jgi:hypothetical protein
MSDAAVGSISHILKTAFQDVYKEKETRNKAQEARALLHNKQQNDDNNNDETIQIDENAIENYYESSQFVKIFKKKRYKLQSCKKKGKALRYK